MKFTVNSAKVKVSELSESATRKIDRPFVAPGTLIDNLNFDGFTIVGMDHHGLATDIEGVVLFAV